MKPHKKLTLNDCTKPDLIWIINRVLQMTTLNNADHYINRALSDLSYEKENKALDEAEQVSNQSKQKWDEYIAILAPYDGKPIKDIPLDVLHRAQRVYDEAIALDKKWTKLLGLEDA